MKKITIACLAGMLLFAACENEGSSTVGTYEHDDSSQSSENKEGEGNGEYLKEKTQSGPVKDSTAADTSKTNINAKNSLAADSTK